MKNKMHFAFFTYPEDKHTVMAGDCTLVTSTSDTHF